jgi:hypothetical protein
LDAVAGAAGEVDDQVADLVAGQRDQCVRAGVVGSFGRGGHGEEGVREHRQERALPAAVPDIRAEQRCR